MANKVGRDWDPMILVPVVFAVVGIGLLVVSGLLAWDRIEHERTAPVAEGRIDPSNNRRFSFVIPDGRLIESGMPDICLSKCVAGATVTIRYDRNVPRRAELVDEPGNWVLVAGSALFGLAFAGMGLGALRSFMRGSPAPAPTPHVLRAQFHRVVPSVDNQGPFWRVQARSTDPVSGRVTTYESPRLRDDPEPYLGDVGTMRVLMLPDHPDGYRLQLDMLPPAMQPRVPRLEIPPAPPPDRAALRARYRASLGIAAVLLVMALGCGIWGAQMVLRESAFRADGLLADGRIVDLVAESRREEVETTSGRREERLITVWRPVFTFTTAEGREYQAEARFVVNSRSFGVGDAVRVRYDPRYPVRADLALESHVLWTGVGPFALASFLLLGAILNWSFRNE